MKKMFFLLILFFAPMFVSAAELQANTTITIDWIGNDMFYIRTESGDQLFNATKQDDTSFNINITRHQEGNATQFEIIYASLINISSTCNNMSLLYHNMTGYYDSYYRELDTNWSRCNLDKNALMEAQDTWKITFNEFSVNMTNCKSEQENIRSAYNVCTNSRENLTATIEKEKRSNNQKTILVIICMAIAGFLVWQEIQRKGKAHPDEMSLLSQG